MGTTIDNHGTIRRSVLADSEWEDDFREVIAREMGVPTGREESPDEADPGRLWILWSLVVFLGVSAIFAVVSWHAGQV